MPKLSETIEKDAYGLARGRRLGMLDYQTLFDGNDSISTAKIFEPLRNERQDFGLSIAVANTIDNSSQFLYKHLVSTVAYSNRDFFMSIYIEEEGKILYPHQLSGEQRPINYFIDDIRNPKSANFWLSDVLYLPASKKAEKEIARTMLPGVSLILANAAGSEIQELQEVLLDDRNLPIFYHHEPENFTWTKEL